MKSLADFSIPTHGYVNVKILLGSSTNHNTTEQAA